ncbi:hypothetical protein [Streptomyces sp. NPDC058279]|uniref:hypothetical protein n=1 Tax=Streptomyces sp. NPDC058279 TaxID=3346418 RepID=UPI0036E7038C
MVILMTDLPRNQLRLRFTDFVVDPHDPDIMRRTMDLEADVLTFEGDLVTFWLHGVETGSFPSSSLSAIELASITPPAPPRTYAVEEVRKQHGNAYQKWSHEDEELLVELHSAGHTITSLARHFARQPGAIRSRLAKLGVEQPSSTDGQTPSPPF